MTFTSIHIRTLKHPNIGENYKNKNVCGVNDIIEDIARLNGDEHVMVQGRRDEPRDYWNGE